MAERIEDYAMIGDCRTTALVCRDGSIDWLCVPRFDSPAMFAKLLGGVDNGRWLIAPKSKAKTTRAYRDTGLVLETTFKTGTGEVSLIDFMPIGVEHPSIIRLVVGKRGKVQMHTEFTVRFDYGYTIPWVSRIDKQTLAAVAGPNLIVLRTPVALHGQDMRSTATFTVKKGETIPFVMSFGRSYKDAPPPLDTETALGETEEFWKNWSALCTAKGRWAKAIRRSLATLKGLTYSPTGGMVAAPTTSLPEQIGGPRNWDYRYCWLRDATFTLLAFMNAGYREEATSWQNWLMRAIAGSPEQIQTMYGVGGERSLEEMELPWLSGFAASRPVRVGNAAATQLQLDIYGELADMMAQATKGGLPPAPRRTEIREVFLEHLEKIWRKPDEGIWEIRGEPQHFVHSKAMTWVAFDRASRGAASAKARAHYRRVAKEIHADICKKGVDTDRGCFVQSYGSKRLDASLLLLAVVGFLPATDKRIVRTVEEIERTLLIDGLVMRYRTESGVDGLPPGEGAFLACSFWLADNYVMLGRTKEAEQMFDRLIKLANDVGLLSEEYDPRAKRMLGNFPQAFSHVALVNTAINIMHAKGVQAAKPVKRDSKDGHEPRKTRS
ncbi:MAG TPA: glycoside hydrolase family 15 protein [Rhizomicrobium sp.]|jgi:GH15 family glucan-1,4-alpha-glucosidase|nr:glycoside hydrolase family 15 protein [Rhizomicrobium sp.]